MQGRFKRDGSASAKPEPHGGTGPMKGSSSPQHAQNPGSAPAGDRGERAGRSGTAGSAPSAAAPAPTIKPATGRGVVGPGSRMALRNWRISTRLVSLLALPVVAATTLGALRINENLDDIQQLDNMKLLTDMTKQATELAAALQEERDQSAGPLSHPSSASAITVKGYQEKTDRAKENFIDASEEIDAASKDGDLQGVRDTLVGLAGELNELGRIRKAAYEDEGNSARTIEAYHRLITELLDLSQDMAEATSNPEMIQRTRALAAFSSAKEYASIQRAVIAAALPASNSSSGHLSVNDRLYGQSALDGENSELNSFRTIYGSGVDELLKPVQEGNPTIQAADVYAKRALDSDSGLSQQDKRSYRDWVDDSSTKIEQMKKIEHTLLEEMEQKARELRGATERDAIISGALVLLVLGVSLVGAFVVARSMIRSLRRLQDTATKVAQERLPELVKQLSEADPQDVDTSVESVGVHSRDEIGQVAAAFDEVHREAVRLAAEQAMLRGNVNAMFTNLSRRSQGLIQRQLSLISELESREADPDQLASLFKLDHLATRMRRNGENLLVLAGEEPGRRWTRPVPLVDVLRAAASEVEQYERIELSSVPTTEVAGRVVNDLVHLLAELLENATSFSSPQTKVKVTGHALPDGRVLIEIHDTGIGLSPEDLAAINERLASPPTVDVSVSRRMGLFVVGRLSQRHGIRIQLRPSDSGGTTALVMLPVDVAQGGRKPAPGKGGGPSGAPAAAAAAAGAAAARRQAQQSGQAGLFGGSGGSRGQVGTGQGPRAALPGNSGRPGGPGGPGAARGPQGPGQPQQGRAFPAGAGAGNRAPAGAQGLQTAAPGGAAQGFGGRPDGTRQDVFGGARGGASPQQTGGAGQSRAPQLPSRGGPRAELPGGAPQSRTPSWGSTEAGGPATPDTPRGHDEAPQAQTSPMPRIDDRQGPGTTAEMPALPSGGEWRGPAHTASPARPGPGAGQHTGSFVRSDVFGPPAPDGGRGAARQPAAADPFAAGPSHGTGATGQYPAVRREHDADATGRYPRPGHDAPAAGGHALAGRQDPAATGAFPRPQPADPAGARRPAQPRRQEPEALPPAPGGSDLGTPLYDTLETDWFRGGRQRAPEPEQPPAPQRNAATAWRSSPNDDLVRRAERVRQPASGGVTTSGLPRRVPRANLVPGTAQQQQHQSGPQVSRAPDDVRGRLTNLRRGIAQGRRAGSGQTGTFPSPTHQQERQ
ncbi:sensor histidine kinase [Streptomyces thermodiastaticus]|uniref:sensor histidine kinase n=1 Tax=Streptomyces thermodiastaticus TaxID=44061 RepID=UPI001F3837B8|nr:nitrate- and nitrite sensing domain-containing protein [Streptomyces thermodiastaticus]MCE7552845.1 nitrate- and nitrite sensing domain-containing protein [Streptomyces thermodiastaticus]